MNPICGLKYGPHAITAMYIADQALEYWLGKTDKVKYGSKIEILINVLRAFRSGIKPKEK